MPPKPTPHPQEAASPSPPSPRAARTKLEDVAAEEGNLAAGARPTARHASVALPLHGDPRGVLGVHPEPHAVAAAGAGGAPDGAVGAPVARPHVQGGDLGREGVVRERVVPEVLLRAKGASVGDPRQAKKPKGGGNANVAP